MRSICLTIILFQMLIYAHAQDTIILRSKRILHCHVVRVGAELVCFSQEDTLKLTCLSRSDVLMVMTHDGGRYIFANFNRHDTILQFAPRRFLAGIQPLDLIAGRASIALEWLSPKGTIGYALPLILSFKLGGTGNNSNLPTDNIYGFITGLDVNYYFGKRRNLRKSIGPRLRYGYDIQFGNLEAITLQTQLGIKYDRGRRFAHHFMIGYGLVKIISAPLGTTASTDLYQPWGSITYRFSLAWSPKVNK